MLIILNFWLVLDTSCYTCIIIILRWIVISCLFLVYVHILSWSWLVRTVYSRLYWFPVIGHTSMDLEAMLAFFRLFLWLSPPPRPPPPVVTAASGSWLLLNSNSTDYWQYVCECKWQLHDRDTWKNCTPINIILL